jgi:hypothetical protein
MYTKDQKNCIITDVIGEWVYNIEGKSIRQFKRFIKNIEIKQ